MTLPPVALTAGEPAGVGLELSFMAWSSLRADLPFFLIADRDHAMAAAGGIPVIEITEPAEATAAARHGLPLMHHAFPEANHFGRPSLANAPAVVSAIERAVALVQAGQAAAVTTNPIHKKVLKDGAGFAYPGHTEFLAALGGVTQSVMMLAAPALRVVPVTIHIPLADVPRMLTAKLLQSTLETTHAAMVRDFAIESPRIAVAGLNPHAGEGGAMGREDIDLIVPVLETLRGRGMTLLGPLPADTMFHAEARSAYDVAVCMYHDQALVPLKTLDFHGGVNITLGLPFIRTSPDHGTALDIAGKGIANPSSLISALRQARDMALRRAGCA